MSHDALMYAQCEVLAAGYRWARVRVFPKRGGTQISLDDLPEGWALVENLPSPARRYNPLVEEPALFRTFADLEPSQEKILAFASQYGRLGPGIEVPVSIDELGEDVPLWSPFGSVPGELLGDWEREIRKMRHMVDLWEMVRGNDVSGLGSVIRWYSEGVRYEHQEAKIVIADTARRPERWARLRRDDVLTPALYLIHDTVADRIGKGGVSPTLLLEEGPRLGLALVPNGLLGALWLQFANAVDGEMDYQHCAQCGKWFKLDPALARVDKRFCSVACRAKAYRRRQSKARELASKGVSVEEIAAELGSTPDTVRGWIIPTSK